MSQYFTGNVNGCVWLIEQELNEQTQTLTRTYNICKKKTKQGMVWSRKAFQINPKRPKAVSLVYVCVSAPDRRRFRPLLTTAWRLWTCSSTITSMRVWTNCDRGTSCRVLSTFSRFYSSSCVKCVCVVLRAGEVFSEGVVPCRPRWNGALSDASPRNGFLIVNAAITFPPRFVPLVACGGAGWHHARSLLQDVRCLLKSSHPHVWQYSPTQMIHTH